MPLFSVLHISDLHLRQCSFPRYSQFYPEILEEISLIISQNRNQINAILITGDLTDTSSVENLSMAYDFVAKTQPISTKITWLRRRKSFPTIYHPNQNIFLLPGNHDRYRRGVSAACTNFDDIFSPDDLWSVGRGGVQIKRLRGDSGAPLVFISADFTLEHESDATAIGGRWGQGKVYEERLDQLVEKTQQVKKESSPIIWLVHFPPAFQGNPAPLSLIDENKLLEQAKTLGVRHILCGHTHKQRNYNPPITPMIHVHCAGTACCRRWGHDTSIHYMKILVENNEIVEIKRTNLFWNRKKTKFEPKN